MDEQKECAGCGEPLKVEQDLFCSIECATKVHKEDEAVIREQAREIAKTTIEANTLREALKKARGAFRLAFEAAGHLKRDVRRGATSTAADLADAVGDNARGGMDAIDAALNGAGAAPISQKGK